MLYSGELRIFFFYDNGVPIKLLDSWILWPKYRHIHRYYVYYYMYYV